MRRLQRLCLTAQRRAALPRPRTASSSTCGASILHLLHHGAQNLIATLLSAQLGQRTRQVGLGWRGGLCSCT